MRFEKKGITKRREWVQICSADIIPSAEIDYIYETQSLAAYEIKFLALSAKNNLDNITARLDQYRSIDPHKRKSGSLSIHILKYGEVVGTEIYSAKIARGIHTLPNYIKKYGSEIGEIKYNEMRCKKPPTLLNFIRRYGLEEGSNRYKQTCEHNKGNHTLARKIEKWGYEEGIKRYSESRNKMKYSSSLDGMIARHGIIRGTDIYQHKMERMYASEKRNKCFSAISQRLFTEVYSCIKDQFNVVYFASLNKEYYVDRYFLDFFVYDNHKCIEFNGDLFHANPTIYSKEDKPHPFLTNVTADDLWNFDLKRRTIINSHNITILTVWEKDFKYNPTKVILECVQFLTSNE